MKYAIFIIFLVFLQNPSPSRRIVGQNQQSQSRTAELQTQKNQRGTEQNPLFIKQVPTTKTDAETTQENKDREEKAANDRKLVDFTGHLVTATWVIGAIGLFQLFVFGYQAIQLRRTVEAATAQSDDMKRSITESARTAKAMEDVAKHFDRSVTQAEQSTDTFNVRGMQQTRAYICVEVGTAAYQDRATNTKFAAQTVMLNAGNTPAHNVRFRAKAAILALPLPEDFTFPLPLPIENVGGSVLGPHQRLNITQIIDDFVPDAEVEAIKKAGGTKALYIWGIINYNDVFHEERTTRFCQLLYWLADGKTIMGTYILRHNDAS